MMYLCYCCLWRLMHRCWRPSCFLCRSCWCWSWTDRPDRLCSSLPLPTGRGTPAANKQVHTDTELGLWRGFLHPTISGVAPSAKARNTFQDKTSFVAVTSATLESWSRPSWSQAILEAQSSRNEKYAVLAIKTACCSPWRTTRDCYQDVAIQSVPRRKNSAMQSHHTPDNKHQRKLYSVQYRVYCLP